MASGIRAVLCDLDDTLFDHQRATWAALAHIAAREPALAEWPLEELVRRHGYLLETLHAEVLAGRMALDAARALRFKLLLEAAAVADASERAPAVAGEYRTAYRQTWYPVEGAVELADAIKRDGCTLVIITNNTRLEPEEKIDRCGLAPYVDALVTSEEIGISKPDPGIFRAALARVDAVPGDAVMVGDNWPTDIHGARASGIRAVWLNRFERPSPDAGVPQLRSLLPTDTVVRVILGQGSEA